MLGWLFLFLVCGLVSLVMGMRDLNQYRRWQEPILGVRTALWFLGFAVNLLTAVALFFS
jgi:hypothetical protein